MLPVLLETERVASELLGVLQSVAAEFCDMEVFTSFDAFGSDHVPYLDQDIPAVLTIDNDYPTYPSYHRTHRYAGQGGEEDGRGNFEDERCGHK